MKYKAIIFDLDGTLLDTLTDLAEGTNYALRVNGFPERTIDEIRRFVGNGARKLVERAVPDGQVEAALEQVRQDFNVYYKVHCKDHTGPYPGTRIFSGHLCFGIRGASGGSQKARAGSDLGSDEKSAGRQFGRHLCGGFGSRSGSSGQCGHSLYQRGLGL